MTRWTSGEDHGGVTLEELKSLYEDWKAARARPRAKLPPRSECVIVAAGNSYYWAERSSALDTRANRATLVAITWAADRSETLPRPRVPIGRSS